LVLKTISELLVDFLIEGFFCLYKFFTFAIRWYIINLVNCLIIKNTHTTLAKKLFCFIAFFTFPFFFFTIKAQNRHTIDSLQSELHNFDSYKREMGKDASPLIDSTKANLWYRLLLEYWVGVPDSAKYYARQILTLSQQIGYMKGIAYAYNGLGLINMQLKNYTVSLDYYQKALKIRKEIGDKDGMAWTYNDLGLSYGNQGNFDEAIKYHLQSLKIKREIGDKPGMAASYGKIGHNYAVMGKLPDAVNNYLNALKIHEEDSDKTQIGGVYGDIGDIYYSVGNYPAARISYLNEYKIAYQFGDKLQRADAASNMGKICYKQGNDTGAITYMMASLKTDYETHSLEALANIYYNLGLVNLAMGNYSEALRNADSALKEGQIMGSHFYMSRVSIEIGSIYEKQGKLKDALEAVETGLSLATGIGARVVMQEAYAHLADINAAMQNYKEAYGFYKDYITNLDSISSNESVKKIAVLEMNYAFDKKEDSIRVEEEKNNIIKTAESKRKSLITAGAIVISLLTLVLAIVFVNRQQLKHKKDKIIFEKEKQQIENELANAKTILGEYIQSMAEKNKLLEEFKADMEVVKRTYDKERTEKLEYLNKATILTDEDWNKFKQLFEQVYKGFFKRLKDKLPDLTQAEIRLVCLTKLSVGTKQMAGILGVSFDTIKKSRHRFRKKLGLSEEDSLDDVVNTI
jgi:tetratricopeptide (TPR) repeat protein